MNAKKSLVALAIACVLAEPLAREARRKLINYERPTHNDLQDVHWPFVLKTGYWMPLSKRSYLDND